MTDGDYTAARGVVSLTVPAEVAVARARGDQWAGSHELVVDVLGRPLTANQVRRIRNRHQLAALVRAWHDAGTVLARANRLPRLDGVHVWAWGRYPDRRSLPDADAVAPAVKAVVDGIVAAGVLPDDKPPHVQAVTYCAPVVAPGLPPALVVRLVPVSDWVHPAEGDA